MRPWGPVFGAFFAVLGSTALSCIDRGVFLCQLDSQCGPSGACEASGFCSYPDDGCESGRRYSQVSSFGDVCTEQVVEASSSSSTSGPASGGGSTSSMGSTGDTDSMVPLPGDRCGDAVVDIEESCDDGNRTNGDGCNSYCIAPGATVWETGFDSEDHLEDRAFAIALSQDASTFAIAGVSASPGEGWDILVQLYDADRGDLLWTYTHAGDAHEDDRAEEIAFDSDGNIVVAGVEVRSATDGDLWLAKLNPQGEVLWSQARDDDGGYDWAQSVARSPDGSLVVAGNVSRGAAGQQQTDIWLGRFSGDGSFERELLTVDGDAGQNDQAIDVLVADDATIYATGSVVDESNGRTIWTAELTSEGVITWQDRFTHPDPSNSDRGVGIRLDSDGNVIVAGTASQDIWLRRFGDGGSILETIEYPGPEGLVDEASDVVFAADGSFVVTGFTGFATQGFARSDIWVSRFDAENMEQWTVWHDGDAEEIDKALAVAGLEDGSVIAAGYVTTPGQMRDVWLRKIAP